jgi:hypothetical protein
MLDTTQDLTATITRLITTGSTEQELLAAVARKFPELTRTEFVAALQDATAQAERQAARRH